MKKYEATGELLKMFRTRAELTQTEVAAKLKIHVQYVSNWERGLCLPPAHASLAIAKLYKLPNASKVALTETLKLDVTLIYKKAYSGLFA